MCTTLDGFLKYFNWYTVLLRRVLITGVSCSEVLLFVQSLRGAAVLELRPTCHFCRIFLHFDCIHQPFTIMVFFIDPGRPPMASSPSTSLLKFACVQDGCPNLISFSISYRPRTATDVGFGSQRAYVPDLLLRPSLPSFARRLYDLVRLAQLGLVGSYASDGHLSTRASNTCLRLQILIHVFARHRSTPWLVRRRHRHRRHDADCASHISSH
ncbi:hypothetical protein K438DRAFT_1798732 [Mycena galopus ATCC 62051]|nr:hypothetical protein K438DRAFT_1798732 [Mycena galopus ATCC 62051]